MHNKGLCRQKQRQTDLKVSSRSQIKISNIQFIHNLTFFDLSWFMHDILLSRGQYINAIQDRPFWGCSRMGKAPFPKICYTYYKMMKLGRLIPYLKNIQEIYKSLEISNFCYIRTYRYRFRGKTDWGLFCPTSSSWIGLRDNLHVTNTIYIILTHVPSFLFSVQKNLEFEYFLFLKVGSSRLLGLNT